MQRKNGPFRGHSRVVSIAAIALLIDHHYLVTMAPAAVIAAMVVAVHMGAGAVPVASAVMMAVALDDDGLSIGV